MTAGDSPEDTPKKVHILETRYADNDAEAEERSNRYRDGSSGIDPFDEYRQHFCHQSISRPMSSKQE